MSVSVLDPESIRSHVFRGWYLRLIAELNGQGGEVAATPKNAATFCGILSDLAEAGKAAVLASYLDSGEMAGFGGAYSTGLDAASGGQLWAAVGTYVAPAHRGKGLARELRAAAMKMAKRAGATHVTAGRYTGQTEEIHPSMKPIQTLYLVTL